MLPRSGEITAPWPVPLSATVTTPSSRMPALSHLRIRRIMRSPTRCSKNLTSQSWPTLPKEGATTTHHRDFPDSVIITRERHPFEGCTLAVIGSIRRRGVLFVQACLPDGSRALIPARWTDWDEGHGGDVRACGETNVGSRAL